MQLAISIYLLTMMLLWQINGNLALTFQRPDEVSQAERSLWGNNNAFSLLALLLAKSTWIFALAYPIYLGITKSVLQAIILLVIGNLTIIIIIGWLKRIFRVPEIILVYIGIVICPFLMVGIWFIGV